ncbi:MAG TPA: DUF938 domain-containing protein [Ramlibacter sp.]|nr:DUF938 domain-containing protein [Ramlibacter sp.]
MPEQTLIRATDRNRQPILEQLQGLLPAQGSALEIASGSGQHALWFTAGLPGWRWQASEVQAQALPSLAADLAGVAPDRLPPPVRLDVLDAQWPSEGPAFNAPFDVIFCANMLHIAPWETCAGLMQGSARHLAPRGLLVIYGPFLEDAVRTAASNQAFDEDLRRRNAQWGLRKLQDVLGTAAASGLRLQRRVAMPANNLLLVFSRGAPAASR